MKPQNKLRYMIVLSLVYATIMLISSTIFADTEHSQSVIMPLISIWVTPFFLLP